MKKKFFLLIGNDIYYLIKNRCVIYVLSHFSFAKEKIKKIFSSQT